MNVFKKFAPLLLTAAFLCLPLVTLAVTYTSPGGSTYTSPGGGGFSIENPLKVTSICALVKLILEALMIIGLPIAVLFLVYVGFKYIVAQGNPTKISEANRNLFNTVIGIGIFLGAWTIAQVIANTMRELGVTGFGSC